MQGNKFDAEGNIIQSHVYIIWGSPASGKTTYVKQNMMQGDLIVDLDLIKQSISMSNKTETHDQLLNIALDIRELLYKKITDRNFQSQNVWVIASLPKAEERKQLQHRLKAELVFIDTAKAECINRATKDQERNDKDIQMQIISKWFNSYYYDDVGG